MLSLFEFVSFFALMGLALANQIPAEVHYEWKYINFTWPSSEAYENAVNNREYVRENNFLAGIKLWKGNMYLTIPRWKDGVPATLLVTSADSVRGDKSPLLEPYPNWDMQKIGDCSAFQFVQSMEIDPLGRMWVIDTGRVATLTDNPKNYCPPRLVILDLENNGEIILNYVFPEEVANRSTVYLNDIVLEHEDGGHAFITNTDDKEPSIIVFSLKTKSSWKVTHPSMKATAVEFTVKHDNTKVTQPLNVDGIAISPASSEGNRLLYYTPLSSLEIFTIPTNVLKSRPTDVSSSVKLLGEKPSQTDGMIVSADGRLYFGLLADNAVSSWDSRKLPFQKYQYRAFEDEERMQWPDTFAIDVKGVLWTVSNRLQRLLTDTVDASDNNFRVLKLTDKLKTKNYMYYEDGRAPRFPSIN